MEPSRCARAGTVTVHGRCALASLGQKAGRDATYVVAQEPLVDGATQGCVLGRRACRFPGELYSFQCHE